MALNGSHSDRCHCVHYSVGGCKQQQVFSQVFSRTLAKKSITVTAWRRDERKDYCIQVFFIV